MQGLGGAFLEHLVYDEDGQLLTGSLADYLMPTASDFPSIRAVALELKPSPHNPLGAKGAGEGGIIPVGGVVANAVAAALSSLGVEPRELPLSPPRVWQLIAEAKRRTTCPAWSALFPVSCRRCVLTAECARAQSVEEFYRGKTIIDGDRLSGRWRQ